MAKGVDDSANVARVFVPEGLLTPKNKATLNTMATIATRPFLTLDPAWGMDVWAGDGEAEPEDDWEELIDLNLTNE